MAHTHQIKARGGGGWESIPADSDLALFHVSLPQMQDLQPCQISCRGPEPRTSWGLRSPAPAALASLCFTGAAPPCSPARCRSPEDSGAALHLLAAFPAPSTLLLFKAVSERRVRHGGWPVHSQEPGRTDVTAWLASCRVLGVWAQPHSARTRGELWGLDFFLLFSIFPYLI